MVDATGSVVRLLAFDYGLKTIGVAIGQSVTGSATPLPPIRARNGKPNWTTIAGLIREWDVNLLVIGLPLNMDDTESDMSALARKFASDLSTRFSLPATFADERLTSREALAQTQGDWEKSHGVAAMLIAESYLRYVK